MDTDPVPGSAPAREVYTVSRLNREARALIENGFPPIWIEGEISNLARPSSGHLYFGLKDAAAQIRCALFRSQLRLIAVAPRDGMQVLVRARVTLYEGRGEFQLIVEHLEEAGEGMLRRAFEALKTRLAKEGLFDAGRKKPLPRLPRRIGIVTSPTGAVLHDMLTTLRRRFPAIPVLLYPVAVQGRAAAPSIVEALRAAGSRRDCDVLILARGGGSLEDLWGFNEEILARALANCPIPVVSGVGHETDFTIADLAADVRAPTPTAAAELVTPDQNEWLQRFVQIDARVLRLTREALRGRARHVDWLAARLVHPRARLAHLAQTLETLTHRLRLAQSRRLHAAHVATNTLVARLERASPLARLHAGRVECGRLSERLHRGLGLQLAQRRSRLTNLAHGLRLAQLQRLHAVHASVNALATRLERRSPLGRLRACRLDCRHLYERLRQAQTQRLAQRRNRLAHLAHALHALSPLATLDRGYAIVRDGRTGAILRDARDVEPGELIETRLAHGRLSSIVKERHET